MSRPETPSIFWFIPCSGDRRYLGTPTGGRAPEFGYLSTVARAADTLGFDGVLIPTGQKGHDPLVLASALAPLTRRLKFLVAVRPGILSPTLAAREVSTLDRVSGGRALVNIVTGDRAADLEGDGLFLDHDERYRLTDEWLTIFHGLLRGEEVNAAGKYLQVKGAQNLFPPVQQPYPPTYFGGSSDAAIQVAGKHVDVYLSWGEPPEQVREKIAAVRRAAEAAGRSVRFGIRLHVVVRKTEQEAWEAAEELIRYADAETIARARAQFGERESVGQQRMLALHGNAKDRASLRIGRHLWAGIGLLRGGAGTALVGDPGQVAAALDEYRALGVDTFVLSGYPHLEEAYYVAELLFPAIGKATPLFQPRAEAFEKPLVPAAVGE